jgi:hypothetical protein
MGETPAEFYLPLLQLGLRCERRVTGAAFRDFDPSLALLVLDPKLSFNEEQKGSNLQVHHPLLSLSLFLLSATPTPLSITPIVQRRCCCCLMWDVSLI